MARKKFVRNLTEEEKIEHGLELLDRIFGEGWPLLIDLDTFDIGSGDHCILGQIGKVAGTDEGHWKNSYHQMQDALDDINGAVQDYLFEHFVWSGNNSGQGMFICQVTGMDANISNRAWVEAIRKRQEQLGGEPAVKAVRERLTQRRARLANH